MIIDNIRYNVLHDRYRPLCFVGDTYYNRMMYDYFVIVRPDTVLVRVEDIENNDQSWFDRYQFMASSSNTKTKQYIVGRLADKNPHYFSVVGDNNRLANVQIGQGCFVEFFNTAVCNDIVIGNHCSIASYVTLGHYTQLEDFCHVSSYCFVNFTRLGQGSCVAVGTNFFGSREQILTTEPYCNFMTSGTVTKPVTETGTYLGNRQVSKESSISYNML